MTATTRRIRRFGTAVMVLCIGAIIPGFGAQTLVADATGEGELVARLLDITFVAALEGSIEWTGELHEEGRSTPFSTRGDFVAEGRRAILTFISEAWLGFTTRGETIDGRPIEFSGLLTLRRETLLPLRAGDPLDGALYATILLDGVRTSLQGTFLGSASGELASSKTPATIRLTGSGEVRIDATSVTEFESLPEDVAVASDFLTSEFLATIAFSLGLADGPPTPVAAP